VLIGGHYFVVNQRKKLKIIVDIGWGYFKNRSMSMAKDQRSLFTSHQVVEKKVAKCLYPVIAKSLALFGRLLLRGPCYFAVCLAILAGTAGCSWTDKSGTHHLIVGLGFGIITTTNCTGVEVRDSQVLGAAVEADGAGIGWMRHHRVAINPTLASNVVISIKANPCSLTVKNFDPYSTVTNKPTKENN